MTVLDDDGNLVIDGSPAERRDPLTYFSKDASIMHGRFGSYDTPRDRDLEVEANVIEDEENGIPPNVNPAFEAEIAARLQFDRR